MSKLIYIHDDDEQLFNIVVNALKEHGYSPDYSSGTDIAAIDRIHADIALVCRKQPDSGRLTVGNLTLDTNALTAYIADGTFIHLTPMEFSMLSYLMKNVHRAVPRSELLRAVWGFEDGGNTRVADDTAKRLRRKLRTTTVLLETVWNFGFRVREQ